MVTGKARRICLGSLQDLLCWGVSRGIFVKNDITQNTFCAASGQGDRPSKGNECTFPESPFSFWDHPFLSHIFAGQSQLCSPGLLMWHREQITMLYEFGAACFLCGCPVGKIITEKYSHTYHGQSIFLALLWLWPKWGISSSRLSSHQAFSPTSTEGHFSIDHGPLTLHLLPRDFQEIPEQHLVRGSNRQRRKERIIVWISITVFK